VIAKALEIGADLGRVLTPEKSAKRGKYMGVSVRYTNYLLSTS
jgi:hypothetical protein